MFWIELQVTTSAENANELSEQLSWFGAEAITMRDAGDQPIYEPSSTTLLIWEKTEIRGLFAADHPMNPVTQFLEERAIPFELKKIADQDWVRNSLASFKPICFGKRLWVCPSWCKPPNPAAINIILDPGLAFGTGTHPTTALCLEWLDEHINQPQTVIDYGCGSGILGIAAIKLGAKHVLAVDNDPQALSVTEKNREENGLSVETLQTYLPSTLPLAKVDLIIANILCQPLLELAPRFAELLKPKGTVLLSGLLRENVQNILESYGNCFVMQQPVFKEEWVLLQGIRANNN